MGDPYLEFAERPGGRWHVGPEETVEEVRAAFLAECAASRRIVAAAGLQDPPRPGTAFNPSEPHPALI